ncbi:MAG: D-alanyl-D-alanine endopeptidase [Pseudomonadota bacterium]
MYYFAQKWLLFILILGLGSPGIRAELALASVSAVAVDVETGQMLVSEHADLVLPIASLTKVMTAVVVLDSGADLSEWLTIEDWASANDKNAYSRIRVTSKARRGDLLRIALMSSENRAAYNLALHHPGGYERFVRDMNEKAQALGMMHSSFDDPTGLSTNNQASAADLAKLLVAADGYQAIREYSTTRQFTVNFRKPRYRLGYGNTNPLTGSQRWDVGLTKTGYLTEAGRCLVMVAQMAEKRVGVVLLNSLGTRSPLGDAGRIRRWLADGTKSTVAPAALKHRREVLALMGIVGD